MKNPIKAVSERVKKRLAERKERKEKVKFLRVTSLGDITAYIPKNRPSVVVFTFVGEKFKGTPLENSEPILIPREAFRDFLILPGDVRHAKKAIKETEKVKKQLDAPVENIEKDGQTLKVKGMKHTKGGAKKSSKKK